MLNKFKFLMFSVFLLFLCASCAENKIETMHNKPASAGNIQNTGYAVECENGYIYKDYERDVLCKKDTMKNTVTDIAEGSLFSELNLYNGEIYYLDGNPGFIWKMSMDGKTKKQVVRKRAGNLLVDSGHIYFRCSEDDDWGKLYRTDLNGKNAKLLAKCVLNFCIYNNRIYYTDIEQKWAEIRSMNLDGTDVAIINRAEANNLFVVENKLIYSDKNRADKLFAYDLNTAIETCICEDRCWNVNANAEWIFYRNQSDKGNLYRICLNGSEREKIADGNIVDVLVIGNSVFYRDVETERQFEKIDFGVGM